MLIVTDGLFFLEIKEEYPRASKKKAKKTNSKIISLLYDFFHSFLFN